MTSACVLLRDFWSLGVRVAVHEDRFRLTPPGIAPDDLKYVLREYRAEVEAQIAGLPAPDRCQICGEPTNGYGKSLVNCTTCALIAADRWLAERGIELSKAGVL